MEFPERIVCCTLCLCMAVSVFSSVALVYLTALVYMPSKREMASGLSDVPVMCTTIERVETDNCDWYSCGEWCLSKSSQCVKLWAQVRRNGTDVIFRNCHNVHDVTCMVLDDEFVDKRASCKDDADCRAVNDRFRAKCAHADCQASFRCDKKANRCTSARQHRNCKVDGECVSLDNLFLCKDGLCQNVTSVFDCAYTHTETPTANCRDKRNCIYLTGLYDCRKGICAKLKWPYHCDRRCPSVQTDSSKNVLLLAADRMLTANCRDAVERFHGNGNGGHEYKVIWTAPDSESGSRERKHTEVGRWKRKVDEWTEPEGIGRKRKREVDTSPDQRDKTRKRKRVEESEWLETELISQNENDAMRNHERNRDPDCSEHIDDDEVPQVADVLPGWKRKRKRHLHDSERGRVRRRQHVPHPHKTSVLLSASCTSLRVEGGLIVATDCVNGSLLPNHLLAAENAPKHSNPSTLTSNYSTVLRVHRTHGISHRLDPEASVMPFEPDIVIYERTKLLINTEACVNTLQMECTDFYLDHRRDGRNYSANDRFPCYYTPRHGEFVTTRFSIAHTRHVFLLSFAVPASLLVLSCSCLFVCSKMLRIEDTGQMRIRLRRRLTPSEIAAFNMGKKRRRRTEDDVDDLDDDEIKAE